MNSNAKNFMVIALQEAQLAKERGEIPVGAVIINATTQNIVSKAGNRTLQYNDPTAHAELLVIREASRLIKSPRLNNHYIFVTLEPCPMCATAISLAHIERLYFGAYDPKGGGVFHGPRIFEHPTCHHIPEISSGHSESKSQLLLKEFFKNKRK